jgi:hypothetical protein
MSRLSVAVVKGAAMVSLPPSPEAWESDRSSERDSIACEIEVMVDSLETRGLQNDEFGFKLWLRRFRVAATAAAYSVGKADGLT